MVEIAFENGRISNFVYHSSTSTYMANFIEIEETFCGWMDVGTYGRTDI